MKIFSWLGFALIVPILALNIGSGDRRPDSAAAQRERAAADARAIEARLNRPAQGAVIRPGSTTPALTPSWRTYIPALLRPAGTRRPQRVAID